MKTFIRWQGNKSQHINKFIEYVPEFTGTYIEPFVGSGALLLKLQPKKWIINDINKDLINIWNQIKNNPDEIITEFKRFGDYFKPLSKEDKITYCKKITSNIESMPYDLKRASIYLLMKYCCYMSNIIINNRFFFQGIDLHILSRNKYYFLEESNFNNIIEVNKFLNNSNGKIYNTSYEKILDKAKNGDFVFLDPPYIESHNYKFNYNKDETLDESFIQNLYKQVKKLDTKGVKWLMTQADTKQIKEIFKEYHIKKFQVYRMTSKSYVNELLIMNYTLI
jgi:DNA adenine methylase